MTRLIKIQESEEEIRRILARAEGQEANVENQSGVENRPFARRRVRNNAPQRRAPRMNPRTPQVLQPLDEMGEDDSVQQRMQRLVTSQQQCMERIAQVDTRLEQFGHGIRQDAFEIAALTVQ